MLSPDDAGGDGHPPRMADERDRLPRLVDLASQLEQLLGAAHDVGCVPPRDHQSIELAGADLVHAGIDRQRVAPLSLVGLLPGAGDHSLCAFFFQPDLRIPELEVLIEWTRKEEDRLSIQSHSSAWIKVWEV